MTTRPTAERPSNEMIVDWAFDNANDTARRLVETASGGDPELRRGLAVTVAGLGELAATGRRLADLINEVAAHLPDEQLAALCAVTELAVRPHALAAAELRRRADAESQPVQHGLTPRELEVLALLAIGLTAQAIGRRLRLSPRTVAKHQERMYRKLGTCDRLTTVLQAQRSGLLQPVVADR